MNHQIGERLSLYSPDDNDLTGALEREVEAQAEAAKKAIREYKQKIFCEPVSAAQHLEQQRDVARAVSRYIHSTAEKTRRASRRCEYKPRELVPLAAATT